MPDRNTAAQPGPSDPGEITLQGDGGFRATLLTLGARLGALWVPDPAGRTVDVVLGHDTPAEHAAHHSYMGATCGRFANRIAGGRFSLDGVPHQLACNEGETHLHGGTDGFDNRQWTIAERSVSHVTFALTSPAGDMGYPGTLTAACTYRLLGRARLMIEMTATTDAPTIVNFAHHSYFNLAGQGAGDILGHELWLGASRYLPVDAAKLPTGTLCPVAGTAFDFTAARPIGQVMPGPDGFDHCFCLDLPPERIAGHALRRAARLKDPVSGRGLRVWTTAAGLQVYTGAHFNDTPGKAGARYPRFAGIALETQGYPDAPNRPDFPSARLDPGETYRHLMLCDFSPD